MASGPRSLFAAPTAPSARAIALSLLVESDKSEEGVDVLLDRALARCSFDGRERALTVELTYGVLRRRATIDWRLEPVLDKPLPRLPLAVQMVLRLGAYQLLFLDRIPQSAAVNESVNLAKAFAGTVGRDWSGFVNAVLRSLLRHPPEPWPSTDLDAAQALAVRYSVPDWLSRRWVARLGLASAERACEGVSVVPPLTLRVNRLITTRESLLHTFSQAGITAKPTSVSPFGILIEEGGSVPSLPGFHEGAFYVEDEAAQLIPPLLDPQPGDRVFDACAAPGGKSTHVAALMQNQGIIYAIDRKETRLDLVRSNCRRLGVQIVVPMVADIRQPREWGPMIETARSSSMRNPRVGEPSIDRILWTRPAAGSVCYGDIRKRNGGRASRYSLGIRRSNVRSSKRLPYACGLVGCWSIVRAPQNRKKTKTSSSDSVVPMRNSNLNPSLLGFRLRHRDSSPNKAPSRQWATNSRWTDFTPHG